MGATASNAQDKSRKQSATERPQYGALASVSDGSQLSWIQVDGSVLAHAIGWVCSAGDAISGARGRWLGITLLTDSGVVKKQCFSYEELEQELVRITDVARKRIG